METIASLTVSAALAHARSAASGLASQEADRRYRTDGPNRIERVRQRPWPLRLLQEFTQFFSLILWIAAALCFVAEWTSPGDGMARIGYALVIVIVISGTFSFWQEYRNEQTLAALQNLLPQQVQVLRDDTATLVGAERLVIGDVVLLAAGDNVPADCRLIEAFDVRVNDAAITGESLPKVRDCRPCGALQPLRSRNILLAGTSLVSGRGKAVVFATGATTEFGRIAHLTQAGSAGVSPLRRELAHLSRLIAVLAIGIGLGFFAVGAVIGLPFWRDFMFSIGIIVAMVPEGLLPTLTLALVLAAQRMAKQNVLIRHLSSVETLGSATIICTDKTGTLTENRMRVRALMLGLETGPIADLQTHPEIVERQREFFLTALLCHGLHEVDQQGSKALRGDPMEIALVEMGRTTLPGVVLPRIVDEISFDATRMRQSVVTEAQDGLVLYCKGAPESLLPLCTSIQQAGIVRPLTDLARGAIIRTQETMAASGYRVLAFATRQLPSAGERSTYESDMVFLGLVALDDPPRIGVPDAIAKCRTAGSRS